MTLLIKVLFICIFVCAVSSQNPSGLSLPPGSLESLGNDRLTEQLLKCVLRRGPCTPEGKKLRDLAPYVLRNQCAQCTSMEKDQIRRSIAYIQRNFPAYWRDILRMYQG